MIKFSENLNAKTDKNLKRLTILNVFEAIKKRRSIRSYVDKNVSENDIKHMIEAAMWAPSAGNTQPLNLVIVKDKEIKRKISEAALNQASIRKAPIVIVVFADLARSKRVYGLRGEQLYGLQDTAAATQNILLSAHALGLATCWVGAFNEKQVANTLKAPNNMRPVALVPIGYSSECPVTPQRRSVDEFVHYETF